VKFGERAWQLQRIINVSDGLDRKDDTLPLKMAVPAMVGPRAGKTPTPHDRILDDYYELRGWDRNGVPTRERLEALGLGRFAAFLP
jgi:aldehyde:ferredoxin oxidoreductase